MISRTRHIVWLALILAGLLLTRLCHLKILWVEEGYPAAAAIQLLHGKRLYWDVWFDKPPLSAYFYLLWGAHSGWPLRIAGALFVFACCLLAYKFAARLWSAGEGTIAAGLLAFYLTFGIPSAVMALAPDLLLIAPHLAAVYLAWRRRPFWSGLLAGIGLLVNSKAVFVLAACLLWSGAAWPYMLLGFTLPNAAAFAWFGRAYYEEVWQWGAVYASQGFALGTAFTRTANWIGFQAAAVLGAAWCLWKERNWRMAVWVLLSLAGVVAGWRFFPRYYFQLLVPVVLLAARGFMLLGRRRWVLALLLIIPLVRFGPRYAMLAGDLLRNRQSVWSDLVLNQDSAAVGHLLAGHTGTLLVWGYRPDIFVYTRMPAGTRYLDSQPLTGVLADRHLTSSEPTFPELAARNRANLIETKPDYIVDGLGPLNPALAISNYPDLRAWLAGYQRVGRTRFSVIYRRLKR